jgi:multidrug efflux system membrane fusion protein
VWHWLLAMLVLAGGAGAWWWHSTHGAGTDAVEGQNAAPPAVPGAPKRFAPGSRVQPVSVAAVQQRDMAVTVQAIGNMAALNTAVVRARVDAELKALHFKEGQVVQAGQLLAELDNRSQQVALAQAQGQLARDQAQLTNAQLDLARYKDLLAKDAIAAQQVDTQEAQVRQLKGTVQADQAAVDSAQLQLSYTRITAPLSGRLGLKQADLGSMLRSSDANGLVTITQTQPMALVFAVPETLLPRLRSALGGKATMAVEAWDREFRNRLGQGRVTTLDNAIDASTGTLKVKAEFPNADGSLFPNQFVNVRLTLAVDPGALAVPGTALQRGAQGAYVYLVQADKTVTVRRVRAGATDGDWVAISGELSPGDTVVTDGADRLREGAQVDVIAPPKPREAGGGERPKAAPLDKPTPATATAPAPAPAPAPAASGAPAAGTEGMPPWFDRLPPEVQERYKAMGPEDRKAFVDRMRERRRQREAQGG